MSSFLLIVVHFVGCYQCFSLFVCRNLTQDVAHSKWVNLPVDKDLFVLYICLMKKRTKRKIYPLVNTITFAIEGARVIDEAMLTEVRRLELAAIDAFRTGEATRTHWNQLNDMASLGELMALDGVGVEVLEVAEKAEDFLRDAKKRFAETGKMSFEAAGVITLNDLHEYHDLQRQSVSRAGYWLYVKKMMDLRRSKAPMVKII
jgi:phage gp16-like protein